jgi:hypothetical protein
MLALCLCFYSLPRFRRFLAIAVAILLSRAADIASTILWVNPAGEANPLWRSGLLDWQGFVLANVLLAFGYALGGGLWVLFVKPLELPPGCGYRVYLREVYGVERGWKLLFRLRGSFSRQGLRLLGFTVLASMVVDGPLFAMNNAWQYYAPLGGWPVYALMLCFSAGVAFALAFRMEYAQAAAVWAREVEVL